MEAIRFRQSRREWEVYEYTIMPSHLHIFCSVGSQSLKATMEEFKRWTGHQALKILKQETDRFWQDEWFDHWSRSDEQDDRIVDYIRNNPVKAGLTSDYQNWPYRSEV
jgi:putative transposase